MGLEIVYTGADYGFDIDEHLVCSIIKKHTNTKIIFFCPEEYQTWIDVRSFKSKFNRLCNKYNNTLEFWEGNFENDLGSRTYDKITIVTWPLQQLYWSLECVDWKSFPPVENIDRLFVSQNYTVSKHKCKFIDILAKHKLIEQGYVSWHDRNLIDYKHNFFYYDGKKRTFVNDVPQGNNFPEENFKSLFNVVCESIDNVKDISEKTYMCFLAKKPVVVLGHRGINLRLEQLGFKLLHEWFDYSFDNKYFFTRRVDAFVKQLHQYKHIDYNKAYIQMQDVIEHNYNRVFELANEKHIPYQLKNLISRHNVNGGLNYNKLTQEDYSYKIQEKDY